MKPYPIRIQCDPAAKTAPPQIIDLQTDNAPMLVQGDDAEIDIAIALDGALLVDVSGIASVECAILDKVGGTVLVAKTVLNAALNAALDPAKWGTATDQHAAFLFANTETGPLGLTAGVNAASFWLKITATTTDNPAKIITLDEGEITVIQ